jgi:hypothetical protein
MLRFYAATLYRLSRQLASSSCLAGARLSPLGPSFLHERAPLERASRCPIEPYLPAPSLTAGVTNSAEQRVQLQAIGRRVVAATTAPLQRAAPDAGARAGSGPSGPSQLLARLLSAAAGASSGAAASSRYVAASSAGPALSPLAAAALKAKALGGTAAQLASGPTPSSAPAAGAAAASLPAHPLLQYAALMLELASPSGDCTVQGARPQPAPAGPAGAADALSAMLQLAELPGGARRPAATGPRLAGAAAPVPAGEVLALLRTYCSLDPTAGAPQVPTGGGGRLPSLTQAEALALYAALA